MSLSGVRKGNLGFFLSIGNGHGPTVLALAIMSLVFVLVFLTLELVKIVILPITPKILDFGAVEEKFYTFFNG